MFVVCGPSRIALVHAVGNQAGCEECCAFRRCSFDGFGEQTTSPFCSGCDLRILVRRNESRDGEKHRHQDRPIAHRNQEQGMLRFLPYFFHGVVVEQATRLPWAILFCEPIKKQARQQAGGKLGPHFAIVIMKIVKVEAGAQNNRNEAKRGNG